MNRENIIKAIDAYARASGLKQSTICQYALGNRLVYDLLKNGGGSLASIERLTAWMDENPPTAPVKGRVA